jgi:hypothetical protein
VSLQKEAKITRTASQSSDFGADPNLANRIWLARMLPDWTAFISVALLVVAMVALWRSR